MRGEKGKCPPECAQGAKFSLAMSVHLPQRTRWHTDVAFALSLAPLLLLVAVVSPLSLTCTAQEHFGIRARSCSQMICRNLGSGSTAGLRWQQEGHHGAGEGHCEPTAPLGALSGWLREPGFVLKPLSVPLCQVPA